MPYLSASRSGGLLVAFKGLFMAHVFSRSQAAHLELPSYPFGVERMPVWTFYVTPWCVFGFAGCAA